MAAERTITMTRRELKRWEVSKKAMGGEIRQWKAAELLDLSLRQVKRVVRRIKMEGPGGVMHRLRGRPSNRRKPEAIKAKVVKLYGERYAGFGITLAVEKLWERDRVRVGEETLRRWLLAAGLWAGRRRGREHRSWRERKACFGEMVQMDGSHHDWFEGRGPKAVLMGMIDDATSTVYGRFYEYEGTLPALGSLKGYIKKHGIPQSIYLDRHTTYKSWAEPTLEEELEGKKPLSEFERAAGELGIKVIHAYSPQAKGRIERLFGTFQDRLVKEMRLRGIKSIGEANAFLGGYLPLHNRRFRVEARQAADLHGELNPGMILDRILCIKASRALRNDWTVHYGGKFYQVIKPIQAKAVKVEERLDGTVKLYDKSGALEFKEIAAPRKDPKILKKTKPPLHLQAKPYKPGPDHPWRNYKVRFPIPILKNAQTQKGTFLNGQKGDISNGA